MAIQTFISEEKFYHHFQPIYNIDNWSVIGYEVLLRSSEFTTPEQTFMYAVNEKKLYELDSRSIHKATLTYIQAGFSKREGFLFLNVFPSTIMDPNFPSFIKNIIAECHMSSQPTSQQMILEISETEVIESWEYFKEVILQLKEWGIKIAIDDVGKGSASIRSIIELVPDFVKVDKYFADNLHKSKKKQSGIQLIHQYCESLGCKVILEGIESSEDLAMAKYLGVTYAQGFILGKPNSINVFAGRRR